MLKLYDSSHKPLGNIVKYKDCVKESEVATGDVTLSFTYLAHHHNIRNEYYVQTKDAEYTVKEVNEDSNGFPQIVAILNLEDLQRDSWESYSITNATLNEAAQPLLERVGWSVGECNIEKRRNAAMVQVTTLGIVRNLCTAFMCEPVFDNIHKTISFYEERGDDKGVYFMQGLNLRKLDKDNNSYDYYTQIIPIGADGLTIEGVNGGKKYLENYQYSNKVLPYIWKDESYTDAQALMEDAVLKLKDLSRPAVSYSADVIDLAKQSDRYSILSYALGDRVTLIDRKTGTREAQRIVRMVEHENEPEKNSCELGNVVLTFEELQDRLQAAADIVNNTMTSDGKIHVSDILAGDGKTLDSVIERVGKVAAISYKDEPPIDAEDGDIWFDQSDGNKPYRYNGISWQEERFGTSAIMVEKLSALTKNLGDIESGSLRGQIFATSLIAKDSFKLHGTIPGDYFGPGESEREGDIVVATIDDGLIIGIMDEECHPYMNSLLTIRCATVNFDFYSWVNIGPLKIHLNRAELDGYMLAYGMYSNDELYIFIPDEPDEYTYSVGISMEKSTKRIDATGYLYLNGVEVETSASDIRLKSNIKPSDVDALSVIDQISVRQFDWINRKEDIHQKIGFIADELEEIDSKFARGGGYDKDGRMNVKSVDTFYLLGYAVKAIQELNEIVRQQAEQIRILNEKLDGRRSE